MSDVKIGHEESEHSITFYINGNRLLKKPVDGVRYVNARTSELLFEHHDQLLTGHGEVRRIILEHWLPRGMIPFYPGAEFMKAVV
jgi:hypothetical protein